MTQPNHLAALYVAEDGTTKECSTYEKIAFRDKNPYAVIKTFPTLDGIDMLKHLDRIGANFLTADEEIGELRIASYVNGCAVRICESTSRGEEVPTSRGTLTQSKIVNWIAVDIFSDDLRKGKKVLGELERYILGNKEPSHLRADGRDTFF